MSPIRKEPGIAAFKEGEVQVAGKVALGEEAELEVIVEEAENSDTGRSEGAMSESSP